MQQKYLALALSAIFATTALTGCGSDNDKNYQPEQPKPEQPKPENPNPENPNPENPNPGGDVEDNVGNAAEGDLDLRKDSTVGGQQYVRSEGANFDRTLNPSEEGNATVLNSVTIQNKKLDNIVLGRETVERKEGSDKVLRYAGKSVDGFSDKPSANTLTLQEYNANGGTIAGVPTTAPKTGTVSDLDTPLFYFNKDGVQIEDAAGNPLYVASTTVPNNFPLYDNTGKVLVDANKNPLYATTVTVPGQSTVVVGNNIDVTSQLNALNGLVSIKSGNTTDTGLEANSTTSTRIFGKNYRDTSNAATVNSHQFTGVEKDGKLDITGLNDTTKFKNIKLNSVQYGRVTSNIDKLSDAAIAAGGNAKYYESQIVNKGTDGAVDTYFYRGTDETSIAQMNALQKQGGTFKYAGHALMYGIDNSYHGDLGDPNSNSFGGTDKPVEGKGNFVEAIVDMDKRKVTGNVFNVWEVTPNESTTNVFRKDNVVDFSGDIYGNTAKGDANLSYDKKNTGAFKGTFFGKNAEELGGAFNSIEKGYGDAQWGGVFGAQKVGVTKPEDGNANQTEDKSKP